MFSSLFMPLWKQNNLLKGEGWKLYSMEYFELPPLRLMIERCTEDGKMHFFIPRVMERWFCRRMENPPYSHTTHAFCSHREDMAKSSTRNNSHLSRLAEERLNGISAKIFKGARDRKSWGTRSAHHVSIICMF